MRLEVQRRTLRLAQPLPAAYGTLHERELLLVSIADEDGLTGYGEAAPLEPYDGVSVGQVLRALERYRPLIDRACAGTAGGLLEACRRVDQQSAALAAIDLALWDRAGRREGRPVAELLSDRAAPNVSVNATLPGGDRVELAEQAAQAAREGYRCLKLKVGLADDARRVAAVRAGAGPAPALRLDANGAWSVQEAVRAIEALAPADLELVEEPVHGVAAMRELHRRVAVRVSIDETAAEPGALGAGVADAVCLKISRWGGISGLLAAAALARSAGTVVYLASTLDGPLGVAAAVHAAAALAGSGELAPCGLATLGLFEELENPLAAIDGAIALPRGAGLGVEPF